MTFWHVGKLFLASASALALAACGGGGDGGAQIALTPPPVPTPTPPPTTSCTEPCLSKVDIFPGLTSSTEFAVVGSEAPGAGGTTLTTTGFSVRYDAVNKSYIMDFPATAAGEFKQYSSNTPNATWWGGVVVDASGNPVTRDVSVLRPSNPDLQLTYTTLVGYNYLSVSSIPFGWAAFGTATPAGAVPTSGSASYSALVRGSSVDAWGAIEGTASLQFDFGAGKLSGHFDPVYLYLGGLGETSSLGRYDFTNTVYSAGSTTYSGQLSQAGLGQSGSFGGQFTGPSAQELMARWSAPFHDPITNVDSTMFGVWVGKR